MQNLLFAAFEQLLDARIEAAIAAGTYDIGVETLTAESFRIAERRTVYTHAATGAETRCYRVLRKDRNRPLAARRGAGLRAHDGRLLINEQTRRAAVQMHAASLMHDDGNVEIRTRLIRPMDARDDQRRRFEHSHWRKATREEFAALWEARMRPGAGILREQLPHHHRPVIADLGPAAGREHAGLPLRDRRRRARDRPPRHPRGARTCVPRARRRGGPSLSPVEAWSAVLDRGAVLDLAGDMQIRRSLVMGAYRVELTGFTDGTVPQLKALGLTSEIIAWRLRLFVPTAEDRGPAMLAALLDRHPLAPRRIAALRPEPDMSGVSAADLARRLARDAEAVCRHYLSNGHRSGRYWIVGDVLNTPAAASMCGSRSRFRPRCRRQMDRICCGESYVAVLRLGAVARPIAGFYAT